MAATLAVVPFPTFSWPKSLYEILVYVARQDKLHRVLDLSAIAAEVGWI